MNEESDNKEIARTEEDWLANISDFLCDVEDMTEEDINDALRAEGLGKV